MMVATAQLGQLAPVTAEDWKAETIKCATQHPLIRTHATLAGMATLQHRPNAVMLGIGLASEQRLSCGLPFDVLGMLLPAEQVRRAAGAERVVVVIADRHAVSNGFDEPHVQQRARAIARGLEHVRSALGLPLQIVHAEAMHRDPRYLRIHDGVRARAGESDPYVTLEVADTEYLRREHGSIVKLGWSLGGQARAGLRDERYFDERFSAWVGHDVGFAYCDAGRTLDPQRLRAAPYLAIDPARRLLLAPDEPVEEKLGEFQRCAPHHVQRAVTSHLRRITWAYSRTIEPLRGPLVERVSAVLSHIFSRRAVSISLARSVNGRGRKLP